jgi:hypothetical protein
MPSVTNRGVLRINAGVGKGFFLSMIMTNELPAHITGMALISGLH